VNYHRIDDLEDYVEALSDLFDRFFNVLLSLFLAFACALPVLATTFQVSCQRLSEPSCLGKQPLPFCRKQ